MKRNKSRQQLTDFKEIKRRLGRLENGPSRLLDHRNVKQKKEADLRTVLKDTIKSATKAQRPGAKIVDENLLKEIKMCVKQDQTLVAVAYEYLRELLIDKSSQPRLLAVQIIGELFQRSKQFRSLLAKELKFFLDNAVGIDTCKPLPEPVSTAQLLREQALQLVAQWGQNHSGSYPEIRAAYRYLESKKLLLPHIQMHTLQAEAEAERRSQTTQRLLKVKYMQAQLEIPSMLEDIQECVAQIEECYKILVPDMGLTQSSNPGERSSWPFNNEDLDACTGKKATEKVPCASLVEEREEEDDISWESGFGCADASVSPVQPTHVFTAENSNAGNQNTSLEDSEFSSSEAIEEFASSSGLVSMAYSIQIEVKSIAESVSTELNPIVLHFQEHIKILKTKYLPLIEEWISTLTNIETEDHTTRNRLLSQVLEQKKMLLALIAQEKHFFSSR